MSTPRRPNHGRHNARLRPLLAAGWVLIVTGCSSPIGPNYVKPASPLPARFSDSGWRAAHPSDDESKGPWWTLFQDPVLDGLEQQVLSTNPDLSSAEARLRQAEALSQGADAALRPQVGVGAGATRSRTSANRPSLTPVAPAFSTVQNDFNPLASVRWELDLVGRLARGQEAAQAFVGQTRADGENLRLLLTANLASNYFAVRQIDADLQALDRLIGQQARGVALLLQRNRLGQGTALDSLAAESALAASKVQAQLLREQRAPLVAAIAVLTGTPASGFTLAPAPLAGQVPEMPTGVPADLLERRPDIASAERSVAQANAQIGIAASARYPSLVLGGTAGLESRALGSLVSVPSEVWSLGAQVAQVLYDGGRTDAAVAAAKEAQQAAASHYRATVLQAVAEVEGGLAGEQGLALAQQEQQQAVAVATRQQQLLQRRQAAGTGTALDTNTAEQFLTVAQRGDIELQGQRLLAAVYLVKVLGGRW